MRKINKMEKARKLFNTAFSRQEMIEILQKKCKLTAGAASTYYHNLVKEADYIH